MDITVKLNKQHIKDIVTEVVDPFYSKILNDENTKKFIADPELLRGLRIKQVTFATYFYVYPLDRIMEKIEKSSAVHKEIKLDMEFFAKYFFIWAELVEGFIKVNFDVNESTMNLWRLKLHRLLWLMTKNYSPTMKAEIEKEISQIEKSIDNENFYDKKLSARAFLDEYEVDSEALDELEELYKDIGEMFESKDELDSELFEFVVSAFRKYGSVLDATIEFRDIGIAFQRLASTLEEKESIVLSSEKKKFVSVFLQSIVDDLESWRVNIFVKQDTKDIHYLDDSFFSSIAQLEVTIDGSMDGDDDEDVFF